MSSWHIAKVGKTPLLTNPLCIEGLPGIGNVGKVALDFIVDETHATKIFEITSDSFPNSVFVNEHNLVDLPKIEVFVKKGKGHCRDLILLGGDVQPIDEGSSYGFSEKILDILSSFKVKDIVTLGGIGLGFVPKKPKVFLTGNSKEMISEFMQKQINNKLYGIVGPIVGVSGLLLGLSTRRNMRAIAMLAETYGHPMYLGVKGSKEILKVLNRKLDLHLSLEKLESDIKQIENEMLYRTDDLQKMAQMGVSSIKGKGEANYIG